jgi:L,D-transpeptidase YcbB
MSGAHLDRFLASTAIALLLSAGGALAQSTPSDNLPVAAPATSATAPAGGTDNSNEAVPAADPSASPAPAASTSPPDSTGSAQTDAAAPAPAPATPDNNAAAAPPASPGDSGSAAPNAPETTGNASPDNAAPQDATPGDAASGANPPAAPATTVAAPAPTPENTEAAAPPAAPGNSGNTNPPGAPQTTGNATAGSPAPADEKPAAAAPAAAADVAPAAAAPAPANATSPTDTASAPATPPPATVNDQVAGQLHELANGKFDRILGKGERESLQAFYSGRSYAPIWITDGHVNDRAIAAIGYLAHIDADGLNPADYPVPDFKSLSDPQALAEAELKFDLSVITYARHASIGRVAWSRVDANIWYDSKAPDSAAVLAAMADSKDIAATLDGYEPHAPGYLALKAKLAEIRGGNSDGIKAPIPNGPVVKIGETDDRVPALREKLGLTGDGNTYDKELADAVKAFQKDHGLKPTGTLTAPTIDALNGPRPTHVTDLILANMERWRWIPHDLGKFYVMINLPDFTASVFNDGKRIWKTKIVIGKTDMPTPILTTQMKYITVNPTWHVPPSIINHEYLPAMAQDPTVMQRMGLVVERDGSGKVIGIYQPPGDKNAEGRLRFNFPNKFLVYQHDTPDKYMFAYARRAFSHGCMRTQDPAKYAEVLLSLVRPNDGYTEDRIKRMFGPNETNIEFPTFIPINVTYQTAFVDDEGKLEFRDDVYGRDRELLAILHSQQEMRVADIPVQHEISAAHREILDAADHAPGSWGGGPGASGGPVGFFQQLFGGFASSPPPPTRPGAHRRVSRQYRPNDRYSAE